MAYDDNENIYRPETWEDVKIIEANVESLEKITFVRLRKKPI